MPRPTRFHFKILTLLLLTALTLFACHSKPRIIVCYGPYMPAAYRTPVPTHQEYHARFAPYFAPGFSEKQAASLPSDFNYENLHQFHVYDSQNAKTWGWLFVDSSGAVILAYTNVSIGTFSSGLAPVGTRFPNGLVRSYGYMNPPANSSSLPPPSPRYNKTSPPNRGLHTMLKQIIFSINLNIGYAQGLVGDIPDEQFTDQPAPEILINHPAWILGHLATGNDSACTMLGQKAPLCPPAWEKLFGFDSAPQPTRSLYPSKADLLEKFEVTSQNLITVIQSATPSSLDIPMEGPMASFFPTIGNYVIYDATSHTGMHLGQLTTWRRLKKLPRLF